MGTEYALEQQLDQVTEGFRQAEMARKYKEITEAQGPSQQLIDFINADGKLGEEIGLEGFETFSTGTQHEILLSKLNADAMEAVAMEGFKDFAKKYRRWLLGGGILLTLGTGVISIISGSLMAAGVAGIIMKHDDSLVITKAAFSRWADYIDGDMGVLDSLVKEMPTDANESSWDKFASKASDAYSKVGDSDSSTEYTAPLKKSGWDASSLFSYDKWLKETITKFKDLRKVFERKVGAVELLEDKGPKATYKAIASTSKIFRQIDEDISDILKELKKVSNGFDVKPKD